MNIKNTGKTALHLSALNNHRDVVQLLLDNDADVAAADDGGNTPLHYAAYRCETMNLMWMMIMTYIMTARNHVGHNTNHDGHKP